MPSLRSRDLALAVCGLAVLVASTLAALPDSVSDAERAVFRLANDAGEIPRALAWAPMQLGNVVAVPVAALAALATGRARLAVGLAGTGMLAWVAAKGVKDAVERGRPGALVEDAVLRDAHPGGLGFPSGHVAVVSVLAVVVWPHLNRAGRLAAVMAVASVGLLRVYAGAHLPLDITGGMGLGLALGGTVHVLVGWRVARQAALVGR